MDRRLLTTALGLVAVLAILLVGCDNGNPEPENTTPSAVAGEDQGATVGETVTLDGSGSSDADGDELAYAWSLSAPAGIEAMLPNENTRQPTFTPDVTGDYAATLTVSDGMSEATDEVRITAEAPPASCTATEISGDITSSFRALQHQSAFNGPASEPKRPSGAH